jgi:hypothetical protein
MDSSEEITQPAQFTQPVIQDSIGLQLFQETCNC